MLLDHLDEELALVGEVAIKGARRHPGLGGDVGRLRRLEAAFGEDARRRRQQRFVGRGGPRLLEFTLRKHSITM